MGSSCWMQESQSGGLNGCQEEPQESAQLMHEKQYSRLPEKLEKAVFPKRGQNETERLLLVLCIQAVSQDHQVAHVVVDQKGGCALFSGFTQPPHVRNNKGRVTSNTENMIQAALFPGSSPQPQIAGGGWSQIHCDFVTSSCILAECSLPNIPVPVPDLSFPLLWEILKQFWILLFCQFDLKGVHCAGS